MDSITMGVTIGWAMECYRKGVLKKEELRQQSHPEGLELHFGNGDAAVAVAEMIRDQEGIGKLLAQGTRIASKVIDEERGTETYKWAVNTKGLESAGYDARTLKTFALGLATGTRGGCHNRSAAYDPDMKGETNRFTVDENPRSRLAADSEEYAARLRYAAFVQVHSALFHRKADRAGA
jgi:aldehyde:ferredoxin oxidoreductase